MNAHSRRPALRRPQLTTERYITLAIAKKELGHWPRLLKAAGKPAPNIKVRWQR